VNAAQKKQVANYFRLYGRQVPRERIVLEACERFSELQLLEPEATAIYYEVFPDTAPTATVTEQAQAEQPVAKTSKTFGDEYTAEEIEEYKKNIALEEKQSETGKPGQEIIQPDANGEFPTPLDGALWMAVTYGIPQIPLRGKAPFLPNWPDKASTDPAQIRKLAAEYPGCNFGSVAFAGKHFIFEADSVAVRERFKNQSPGHDFTSHLIIESSPGKGHRYYLSVAGVENIGQNKSEDYSIRADGEQCVSPGSIHPVTQRQYRVAVHNGPLGQPTVEEILFWKNQRAEKKSAEVQEQAQIPEGKRNSALASMAGKLLDAGMSPDRVKQEISEVNEARCVPPLSQKELEDTIFHSIDTKWSKKEDAITRQVTAPPVIFGGQNSAPNSDTPPGNWLKQFRSVDEMEEGPIVMVINGVLQEGICFIGANPGDGKTWVALAFAKAISTGTPLFDMPQYDVPEPRTVIYLIPESRDRAFRKRCEAFEMPKDKMKFMARTISAGVPLQLSDPNLLEAVRQTKAVVFLDTAARFMRGTDENAAAQNRLLVNDVVALLAAGATTVVLVHHATKEAKQKKMAMTLENMLRGSSDLGAMCDQAYGIRKDMGLYANGSGPMEIDLVDLKDREDVGTLTSIRLAASYKKPGSIFPVSYINEKHNFRVVDDTAAFKRKVDSLVAMVTQGPDLPEKELAERAGLSTYMVKHYLNGRGFHRVRGGRGGASPWHQDNDQPCLYEKAKKGSGGINLDSPEKRPKSVVN